MSRNKASLDRMEDKASEIVLKIEGDRVDLTSFATRLESFFKLLRELQRVRKLKQEQLTWLISVDKGSRVITATPLVALLMQTDVANIKESLHNGIHSLVEKGEYPPDFSDEALESLKNLALPNRMTDEGVGITGIKINANGSYQDLTPQVATAAIKLLKTPKPSFGSLTGKLEVISAKDGYKFKIHNENRKIRVKCEFDVSLLEQVLDAFGKRVSVYGKITYNRSHQPESIELKELRIIEDADKLPKMYDVLGVLNV